MRKAKELAASGNVSDLEVFASSEVCLLFFGLIIRLNDLVSEI